MSASTSISSIRVRVLNRQLSKWLQDYYINRRPRMKYRLWNLMRRLTGYARLQVPYAENGWITLDERDYLQRIILASGSYEPEVWEALVQYAVGSEILWDVGAHIGSFAIRALIDRRFSQVHCFEPNPEMMATLHFNLALNHGEYVIHPIGLSDRCGTHHLFLGPLSNLGLTGMSLDWREGMRRIQCKTADELIQTEHIPPPTLLKIDVEGWEYQVLQGAQHILQRNPPKAIVFETEYAVDIAQLDPVALFLTQHRYSVHWIPRADGSIEPRENYLAVYQV